MAREIQDPIEQPSRMGGTTYSHPAYGQIHAGRVQGRAILSGTDFVHHAFIKIEIQRSLLHRELSRDWFHPTQQIVEVYLSEAQWATFVSSLNIGTGVPCTIGRVAGQPQAGLPHRTQVSEFRAEVNETLRDAVAEIDAAIKALEDRPGAVAAVKERLRMARQEIVSNVPFVERSFSKHVETSVEHAKTEINAYVLGAVTRAGLRALQGPGESPVELLTDQSGKSDV